MCIMAESVSVHTPLRLELALPELVQLCEVTLCVQNPLGTTSSLPKTVHRVSLEFPTVLQMNLVVVTQGMEHVANETPKHR